MDALSLILDGELFRGIAPGSARELASIAVPKRVEKRAVLFLEGQEGHSMYILAEGAVQLYKSAADGREIVIKTVRPGEIFAEVVLFEAARYPVSAVALSRSLLYLLPRYQVDCLLASESFRRDFIAMLMKKQRYLTRRILYLATHDVEERFVYFLEEQYGRLQEYRISLSKKDMASGIGTIPETFSRMVRRLTREGRIQWSGRILRVKEGFWDEWDRRP